MGRNRGRGAAVAAAAATLAPTSAVATAEAVRKCWAFAEAKVCGRRAATATASWGRGLRLPRGWPTIPPTSAEAEAAAAAITAAEATAATVASAAKRGSMGNVKEHPHTRSIQGKG